MSRIAEQNSGPRAQGPSVRIFLSKKCIRLCPYSKKLNLFQKYSIKSIFFQKILTNFKKNARELFIFQKTYTRNGLFKGRKNFLVVTASSYVNMCCIYRSPHKMCLLTFDLLNRKLASVFYGNLHNALDFRLNNFSVFQFRIQQVVIVGGTFCTEPRCWIL